mgnify:CR=1 FL=1
MLKLENSMAVYITKTLSLQLLWFAEEIFDIIEDASFMESTKMFKAQTIQLKKIGLGKKNYKESIKAADIEKLYTSGVYLLYILVA